MKKIFSAFLLMAAMAFSVGTFVSCNDVMDEIEDVKAQTTQNTAAIDALNAEIADLKNELADAQAAAEEAMEAAEEAQGTADDALEAAEAAALEAAANAEAIETLIQDLEDLKSAYEAKVTELETALAGKVDQTEYNAFVAALNTQLETALARLTTVEGNVAKLLEAETSIKARLDVLEAFKDAATIDINKLNEDLTDAKAQIVKLWDDVNTNKSDIVTLKADVEAAEELLEDHSKKIQELSDKYSVLAAQVATILARVQSLVNVPEYNNGSSDLRFAKVIADQDVTYFPGKTTLRYKVNSTDAAIVGKLVAAYEKDNTILSFDLEAVKVRSVEGDATIEIVGVREDEEKGYLLVDVLAMNFVPEFYTGEASYSAALVLVQAAETNNVASEFTNLVPTADFDVLNLVAKYTGENGEVVVPAYDVHTVRNYAQFQRIPSQDTEKVVYTTANQPYITVVDDEAYYTVESLYAKYGYKVVLNSTSFVTSFDGDDKHDAPQASAVPAHLCWEVDFNSWNEDKFIVANNTIGASREVSLVEYDREDNVEKVKYDTRVYSYLEVVDAYALGGQQVAVADKVQISKNLVYININADEYKWTLQRAIELRGDNGAAYTKTLVIEDVPYSNIYDLSPILTGGNAKTVYTKLNGVDNTTPIKIRNIVAPTSTVAGTADIWFEVGYEFAAANAENPNVYTKQWESYLTETTDAVVTLTATLGKYPETVEVNSEVDVTLITEGPNANDFKGYDTLIADAYTELTPANAGFAADANVNDELFDALTDEANTVVNDPNSAYNLNFAVTENVDKSTVYLFHSQIENVADVQPAYTFKRTIDTWFNVDFVFNVTAKPQLPKVNLVRSTEYAHATDVEGVYDVNLDARLDEHGVYTVVNSDLAFYLNLTGEAHASQSVSFAVQNGYDAEITNKVTAVDPLQTPVNHPVVGEITAYLKKQNSILHWNDRGTEVKVNATLWAGAYPIDYATLNLKVVDPLTFSIGDNITEPRKVEEDTKVQVYRNFTLTSIVEEHKLAAGIIVCPEDDMDKLANIKDILNQDFVTAYGCDIEITPVSVYEKLTNGTAIYDESKYDWDPTTGVLTLKKDDVAELINPIEALFNVKFSHNVHPGRQAVEATFTVTFVQPE